MYASSAYCLQEQTAVQTAVANTQRDKSESEVAQSCLTVCDPMDTRLFRPWDFLGKSTGVGCHFLLQGFFLTQGSRIVDRRFTV